MISLKPGVRIFGVKPEIVLALQIAESVWQAQCGQPLVVTSVTDGRHMPESLHYQGLAADLRLPSVPDLEALRSALAVALGPEFDVILERDHYHLELDIKE